MKKLILLLLISSSAWAQQTPAKKYGIQDFMMIEKVEDQDKYYNENKAKLAEKEDNSFRAELAVNWLAKGNLDKYNYYQSDKPKYSPPQFLNLSYALEKLFDEKKQYAAVAQYTNDFLEELKRGTCRFIRQGSYFNGFECGRQRQTGKRFSSQSDDCQFSREKGGFR